MRLALDKAIVLSRVLCALCSILMIPAFGQSERFDAPVPQSVRDMVRHGVDLTERDEHGAGVALLRKAVSLAPHYLAGHVRYIHARSYLLNQPDSVASEYRSLIAKEPDNPVYPLALAMGQFTIPPQQKNALYERTAKLAPEWAWGHYAKAQLLQMKEPAMALAELLAVIEKDQSFAEPYTQALFIQEKILKNSDAALTTAEKMVSRPDLRAAGLSDLWRLRLAQAGETEAAKAKLKSDLRQLAAASHDVAVLGAVRAAYFNLLKDAEGGGAVEAKIRRLDPGWYEERGVTRATMALGDDGPRSIVYAGRQFALFKKLGEIGDDLEGAEQIVRLERLLALNPDAELKRQICARLMGAAQKTDDVARFVKYGEALYTLNPKDATVPPRIALMLAERNQQLGRALRYALLAEEATREFRPLSRLGGFEGDQFIEDFYSEAHQRVRHSMRRAAALDAYGWVLYRKGKSREAEALLRQAVELARSEKNLSHLAEVLRALGRVGESEQVAFEARNEYTAATRRAFVNEPAKDFEIATVDGRKVKLSGLKGKLVMINFWATWCKPCVREMPLFAKAYEKYKERGLEILAISVDNPEDRNRVLSFANEHKLNFPLIHEGGGSTAKLYGVHSYPTTFFIDRLGNVRYRHAGYDPDGAGRMLEVVVGELMKEGAAAEGR